MGKRMTFYGQSKPPEDAIAAALFGDYIGAYCEVGAYNGIDLSNTYYFYQKGWQGVNFEPHHDNWYQLCQNQPMAHNIQSAVGAYDKDDILIYTAPNKPIVTGLDMPEWYIKSEVGSRDALATFRTDICTLTTVFSRACWEHIDYLSIDTDGTELDVLRGLDLSRWRPRLMIIEFNHALAEMSAYLAIYGYRLALKNSINAFYVQTTEDAKLIAGVR